MQKVRLTRRRTKNASLYAATHFPLITRGESTFLLIVLPCKWNYSNVSHNHYNIENRRFQDVLTVLTKEKTNREILSNLLRFVFVICISINSHAYATVEGLGWWEKMKLKLRASLWVAREKQLSVVFHEAKPPKARS